MKKIIIIGAGYAGLAAVKTLCRFTEKIRILLIDSKNRSELLPLLPNVLGGRYSDEAVSISCRDFCEKRGAAFIHDRVEKIDISKKVVYADNREHSYDYILFASGAVPNYYGMGDARTNSFAFRSLQDVSAIKSAALKNPGKQWYIIGGGYTGVEAAGNLRRLSDKHSLSLDITVLEKGEAVLSRQSSGIRTYVQRRLHKMNIELRTNADISEGFFGEGGEGGHTANVIWTAGVKGAGSEDASGGIEEKNGRLLVDSFLQAAPGCYAAGDVALLNHKGADLPMFSFYARQQGRHAAMNIIRECNGEKILPYSPLFPGFVIPLPGGKGAGKILGIPVRGLAANLVHHFANMLFCFSGKQRGQLMREWFSGGSR